MSTDLEQQLMAVVERVLLKKVADGTWLGMPYGSTSGVSVSREFLAGLYSRLDMDRISTLVTHKVEERIADKIFNQLATELSNDTKSIMCDAKAREAFREVIRTRIQAVAKPGESK
jgi:hypothetical protein